jgi:hypothetical protein
MTSNLGLASPEVDATAEAACRKKVTLEVAG